MSKRYSLLDRKGCVWVFDDWEKLEDWVNNNSDDAPFQYCDHLNDDIIPDNTFKPL